MEKLEAILVIERNGFANKETFTYLKKERSVLCQSVGCAVPSFALNY